MRFLIGNVLCTQTKRVHGIISHFNSLTSEQTYEGYINSEKFVSTFEQPLHLGKFLKSQSINTAFKLGTSSVSIHFL